MTPIAAIPSMPAPNLSNRARGQRVRRCVLTILDQRGPMRSAALAEYVGIVREVMTRHLRRLESDGDVVRERRGLCTYWRLP